MIPMVRVLIPFSIDMDQVVRCIPFRGTPADEIGTCKIWEKLGGVLLLYIHHGALLEGFRGLSARLLIPLELLMVSELVKVSQVLNM